MYDANFPLTPTQRFLATNPYLRERRAREATQPKSPFLNDIAVGDKVKIVRGLYAFDGHPCVSVIAKIYDGVGGSVRVAFPDGKAAEVAVSDIVRA